MFNFKNNLPTTLAKYYNKMNWKVLSQPQTPSTRDLNFIENQYYGLIDTENYSVVPNEQWLSSLTPTEPFEQHKALKFVVSAFNDLKQNYLRACQSGLIEKKLPFGDLKVVKAYTPPRIKYDNHIGKLFTNFNTSYIPNVVGINNITSYDDYVNAFFRLISNSNQESAISLSKFNKTYSSSVLDSGLAINYFDISMDDDSQKTPIIYAEGYKFFKKLCINYGFATLHDNPNILLFDISSPAAKKYLQNYGIANTVDLFSKCFIRTYNHDIQYINNNINLYYNKFVSLYPETIETYIHCNKTKQNRIIREQKDYFHNISFDYMLEKYVMIRNKEESSPLSAGKERYIIKKAKYLQKAVDKTKALGYISKEFKDQVWNKEFGFHDYEKKRKKEESFEAAALEPSGEDKPKTGYYQQ